VVFIGVWGPLKDMYKIKKKRTMFYHQIVESEAGPIMIVTDHELTDDERSRAIREVIDHLVMQYIKDDQDEIEVEFDEERG